ncbi:MAG: acyl-CoA dehydrogenase family protein [bacterium]|jgi:alkylation response protein AidB-like acyl-CoA dehydrogenase|nr:acyl-CoA dehydrogenase family protein [bacterium]
MSGFYNENKKFYLSQVDIKEIVHDLENNFKGDDNNAPESYEEALEWYNLALENAGKICEEFIAPRAEHVDEKGASYCGGVVKWAPETYENMKTLAKAGYMGGTLPRKYGGLNMPVTVNNIVVEMVSQADASLMNLVGLQDIAVTLYKFGNEEQKNRVLPKFCSGEVSGSMALTEPDAGSDLQAVMLKAIEKDGKWYLDGVKRFITNGNGDVSLVLARSEEGTKDGRGLSMFLYERYRDDNMIIRRIEDKHGIHGSPTCELQFNMGECELVGKRRFGLIKYVMSLMNGARLAVSAQAMGIAQSAYDEAVKYANEREQFGKAIVHFPAVYQMLTDMAAEIETTRLLLYHTSLSVDYMDMYERKMEHGESVRDQLKLWTSKADFLTPLTKFTATEMANKVAYDAVQIHGGCGFMKDFKVERLSRDARITNIYEGTTQLQVVAALPRITSGLFRDMVKELLAADDIKDLEISRNILEVIEKVMKSVETVKVNENKDLLDYCGNYFVEAASILYRLSLFVPVAQKHEEKQELFNYYKTRSFNRINYLLSMIESLEKGYGKSIDSLKKPFVKG